MNKSHQYREKITSSFCLQWQLLQWRNKLLHLHIQYTVTNKKYIYPISAWGLHQTST